MRHLALLLLLGSCDNDFLPASYVHGLRVLAVQAEPPEVAPGQSAQLVPLVVDTTGATIAYAWASCLLASTPSAAASVNRDCLGAPPQLTPLGSDATATATMPNVPPAQLGIPDASLGLYLPVRMIVSTPDASITSFYRLRYALGTPPNHNPQLAAIAQRAADGTVAPLDPAAPPVLRAGEHLTLRAQLTADSAESYLVLDPEHPEQPKAQTEQLRVSWFATAGSFSHDVTGDAQPDTDFRLDQRLPAGTTPKDTTIDVWAVAIDERGGTAWLHQPLTFAAR